MASAYQKRLINVKKHDHDGSCNEIYGITGIAYPTFIIDTYIDDKSCSKDRKCSVWVKSLMKCINTD